jgi:hypothetical protein
MTDMEKTLIRQLNELAHINAELIATVQRLLRNPAFKDFDRSGFDAAVATFDQWQAGVEHLGTK